MDSECPTQSRTAGQSTAESGTNFEFNAMWGTRKTEFDPGVNGSASGRGFGASSGEIHALDARTDSVASGSIASRVHRRVADSGDGRYR